MKISQRSVAAEIGLCILFSAVDGEISEKEIGALSSRVGHLLGDDFDVMRLPALLDSELGSISDGGVDAYIAALPARILPEHRYEAVRAACVVACADGLAPEEEDVLRQVCGVLDVDAEDVLLAAFAKHDTTIAPSDTHDDEPNEETTVIAETLARHGWVDPMQSLRDAGISVSGFGALALQYRTPTAHLLRVEHHTCDGSIHLHVSDESESVSDLVVHAGGRERDVVNVIAHMQDDVTLDNLDDHVAKLLAIAPVSIFKGESLVELERPS